LNLCEPFIRRPVMTTLISAAILVFGAMAYRLLPVSDLPNVEFPTLEVTAQLPGANPETIAASVTTPLEREFSTIAGLDTMNSKSNVGSATVTLQFTLNRNIDAAALDVQSAIARAAPKMPPNMPAPPSYKKVNPADQPILYLAVTSATLPMYTINDYADTQMAQRISTISGVAQVQIFGPQKYAVRIRVDPHELSSRGLGIDEVADAVAKANSNLPVGTLYGANTAFTVQTNGQLNRAAMYGPVVIAYRDGRPVHLDEVATASDAVENDKNAAWYGQDRSITLAILKQPGSNTVEVCRNIRALIPTIQAQLPASVSIHVVYDRAVGINDSVNDVKFTLMLTLGLVVMVIFLFLRNLSATIIPSIAIPMSLVGTFGFMYLLGFSVDNFSLMAMTLSIGFVVDDAIVMLENTVRHMENGEPRWEAALKGSREVGFTIISMTISLAAVFIPVMFMGGIVGRLLNEFSITIGLAIVISGFVSLTLTPMLCSRFLKPPVHEHGFLYRLIESGFDAMLWVYEVTLRFAMRFSWLTMAFSVAILGLTVYLFMSIATGFLPNEDSGRILAFTEAAEGVGFDRLVELSGEVAAILQQEPDIQAYIANAGARGGIGASNTGFFFFTLKPHPQRKETTDEFIERVSPKFAGITGLRVFMQNLPPIRLGGNLTKGQYQVVLLSSNTQDLYKYAPILVDKMRDVPGIQDPTTDLLIKNPQVQVTIDRERASRLGISAAKIERALSLAYGTQQISTILAPDNQYQVILELAPRYQSNPDALDLLYVRSDSGKLLPLNAVAETRRTVGPLQVTHFGQLPAVTVSFNLKPGYALGDAVAVINDLASRNMPPTIATTYSGAAQVFQDSLRGLGILLIVTILVIYLVLGILYEDFIHPLTILTGLPFAGFGALVTLMFFHIDLNLYAFVGIIMLVGLVKKNSIMIVDFAIDATRNGETDHAKAIYRACVVRFRPIMMTTFAALFGTLPIAMGVGAGAESRRPLGLAVVGGLLFSQVLTLYVTPVFYLYMESLRRFLKRRRRKHAVEEAIAHHEPVNI
jgi:HAE1 family hydrophobic/amphiphilic exporter-1